MTQPILRISGLTHRYDLQDTGVTDLSCDVFPGEFLILAGPNGCGKTTLLRLLMGLVRPLAGQISLKGQDIFKNLRQTRQTMGLVFQDADAQILGETVWAEIAFGPENQGLAPDAIKVLVDRIMADTGLTRLRDRHPATLSGGEKRRLTIAGTLAMDPEILLFDEPFANLDHGSALGLAQRIQNLNQAGKTIVMATHDLDLVLALADRILVLDQGRIRTQARARDLAPGLAGFGLKPWCPACQPLRE